MAVAGSPECTEESQRAAEGHSSALPGRQESQRTSLAASIKRLSALVAAREKKLRSGPARAEELQGRADAQA